MSDTPTLEPPTRGRIEQAKRFALMNFDKWNDVTGFVQPHTGYYYELASVIEDAVEFGFGVAHGRPWKEIVKRIRANEGTALEERTLAEIGPALARASDPDGDREEREGL